MFNVKHSTNSLSKLSVTLSILIQLESFSELHRNDLYQAAQNEKIWTYHPVNALDDNFILWFNKAIEAQQNGEQIPFVVRQRDNNKIIGSTRFYFIKSVERPRH